MSTNSGGLTPREHDEMRDLVLAGTQRIRPEGRRRSTLVAGAVSLVLVGAVVGGAVVATQNRADTAPATTPSASAGCPDRLGAWVTLGDEFDVVDEPLTEVPSTLAPYVADAGDIACAFASADESVSIVAIVVAEDDAAERFDEIRDAFALDPLLAQVGGGDDVVSFLRLDGAGRLSSVMLRDSRFSADVGLSRAQRVVLAFDRQVQEPAPAACIAYAGLPADSASGGEAIVDAARGIVLPPGVALSPGIQATASVSEPGKFDVTAHVCGDRLARAALVESATMIAYELARGAAGDLVATLTVESWIPVADDAIAADPEGLSVRTDLSAHDWRAEGGVPDTAWE